MDVLDIIELMGNQSGNTDSPSKDEVIIFLRYLNLAYSELLRETILINPYISIIEETLTSTDGIISDFSQKPFLIRHVWNPEDNNNIRPGDVDYIMKTDPNRSYKGYNKASVWYFWNNRLNTYPLITGQLKVQYIVHPPLLELNTPSEELFIPPLYSPILADGACYYIFQEVTGFKNQTKMMKAEEKWKNGIKSILSYFKAPTGNKIYSTYSKI